MPNDGFTMPSRGVTRPGTGLRWHFRFHRSAADVVRHIAKFSRRNTLSLGWPAVTSPSMRTAEVEATARVKRLRRSDIEQAVLKHARRNPDEPRTSPWNGFSCLGASRGCFHRSCREPFTCSQALLQLSSPSAWLRRALENCRVRFSLREPVLGWVGMWRSRSRRNPGNSRSPFGA